MALTPQKTGTALFIHTTDENSVQLPVSATNPIPVSSPNPIQVNGSAYQATVAIVRPANVTAYTALDVVGVADGAVPANAGDAIHVFQLIGPSAGMVIIMGVDLRIDLAAITAGMTGWRLHLYDAAPAAILDNAAHDVPAGDRAKYLGYVDIGAPIDLGSTLLAQADGLNKVVKLAAASTTLYGLLQTIGGFTPTSGESYRLRLRTIAA